MEIQEIAGFVLMLVMTGMILGVGVYVFHAFGDATKESVVISGTSDSFTAPANKTNVTLDHGNITAFTEIKNGTGTVFSAANYKVFATLGKVEIKSNASPCRTGKTCYATYTYDDYTTETRSALNSVSEAVAGIANNWLALIVTVSVLSLIMGLVIRSFRMR